MIYLLQLDGRVPPGIYGTHLREACLPHRLLRPYEADPLPDPAEAAAILAFGGYMGVHDETDYPFLRPLKDFLRQSVEAGIPVLGICLGGQLLADVLGGRVTAAHRGEKGLCRLDLTPEGSRDPLFAGFPKNFEAFEWHNDSFELPPDAVHLAYSAACPGQAFRCRNAWGLQFHPEVDTAIVESWSAPADPQGELLAAFTAAETTHTTLARRLLQNFLGIAAGTGKNLPPSLALHSAGDETPLPPT